LNKKDVLKGLKLAFLASPYSSPLREFVVNREYFEGRFRGTFSSGDFEMTVQDMDIRDMDIHDMDIHDMDVQDMDFQDMDSQEMDARRN
jgi:hypothetical protein